MTTLQDVVDALQRVNCKPTRNGSDSYTAYCPVHEADGGGHKQSLTVSPGDKVAVVVHCHAGCSHAAIMAALGIESASRKASGQRRIVATYAYTDASGKVLFEKVRYEPKDFRIRHRDSSGAEVWRLPAGIEPPLYRLPAVKAAMASGEPVYLVEGEKDADRLAAAGLCATTNFDGAAAGHQKPKWRASYTAALAGADVVLLPDNDEPGRAHMRHIAAALAGKALVRWLELPGLPLKGDASNWLDAGHKVDEFKALAADQPPPAAEVDPVADEVPDWPTSGEEITDAVADVRKVKAPRNEKLPPQNVMARMLATESFENRLRMDPITGHWLEYQPDVGIFRPRPSGAIERAVYLEISKREGAFPASYVSSVVRLLAYEATAEVEPVIGKIPFKNGVLDLQTRELLPHSPDFGFTEAIPYPWNHDAPDPTPVIDWLHEAVGGHEDQVQLLRAFLHAVVVGRPDLQRYLELVGPGGTGKGTFTRLATALVGNKLTHSTTLTQLENNRFETAALFGKKLATITDAEKWHGDVSVMKSITGQDALRYEQKHIQAGEPFTFGGMVIVSANQHMESTDYSSGIQRRRITVRFDHVVQPAQKRDLDSEFAPYLPAVMKWVLDMPANEVTAYLRMTSAHVGSLKQVRLETLAQTNPIAAWLMEAVEFGPGLAAQVGTKQAKRMTDSNGIGKTESWDVYENQDIWLYPNFCRWCDEHGKRPIACNAFGNQLIDVARNMLGHPVVRGDKRRDGSKVVGLRIKPGDAPTAFGDEPVMNRDEPVTYQPIDGDELFKLRQYSDDKSLGARQSAISTSVEAMNRVDCGKVCAEGGESDEVHHLYHNQGLSSSQSITGSSQSITGSSPPGASADAHELWKILSLYRGAEVAARLARKLGWGESRAIMAAQELSNFGRARISGDCIAPIHPPTPDAGASV